MSRVYLKIKIKSLAAEARIIRAEELRLRDRGGELPVHLRDVRSGLHLHRVNDVRREARAAQIAYAFLRGVPLAALERPGSAEVPIKRVRELASRYGYFQDLPRKQARMAMLDRWVSGEATPPEAVPDSTPVLLSVA